MMYLTKMTFHETNITPENRLFTPKGPAGLSFPNHPFSDCKLAIRFSVPGLPACNIIHYPKGFTCWGPPCPSTLKPPSHHVNHDDNHGTSKLKSAPWRANNLTSTFCDFSKKSQVSWNSKSWESLKSLKGFPLHPGNFTAQAPKNRQGPKRKLIFQASFFRGYVKFRWCNDLRKYWTLEFICMNDWKLFQNFGRIKTERRFPTNRSSFYSTQLFWEKLPPWFTLFILEDFFLDAFHSGS